MHSDFPNALYYTVISPYVNSFTTQFYLHRKVWTKCADSNNKTFLRPPKFIVKNELQEGQWSKMSLRWVQPPLRWYKEIINWGSSVSKRGQCFYACRPANNIIQDCQAQNGVWQKKCICRMMTSVQRSR